MSNTIPTHSEARQLASLICHDVELPSYSHFVGEIFKYLQNRDIRNFLFTLDPIQVSHLLNPFFEQSIFSGNISSTRVDGTASNALSDHIYGKFVFYSAFSFANFNLGFGVHQHQYTPFDLWDSKEPAYTRWGESKYVSDDSRSALLIVMEDFGTKTLRIEYARVLSNTSKVRVIARFHNGRFREALQNGLRNISQLYATLRNIQVGLEFRKCPHCHKKHCSCGKQPLQAALISRNPFDHAAFAAVLNDRMGPFSGFGKLSIFKQGQEEGHILVGCKVILKHNLRLDVIQSLRKWAIASNCPKPDPVAPNVFISFRSLLETVSSNDSTTDTSLDKEQTNMGFNEVDEILNSSVSDGSNIPLLDSSFFDAENCTKIDTANELFLTTEGNNLIERAKNTKLNLHGQSVPEGTRESEQKEGSQEVDIVRQLRQEIRKQKNRMAAARSNMRRKALNDARKLEMSTLKEREQFLREKEASLRAENVRLRQTLVGLYDNGCDDN